MANCPNCGEPVGESATACTACGALLTDASGSDGPQTEGQPDGERTSRDATGAGEQPHEQGEPPRDWQPPNQHQQGEQPNQPQGGQSNQQQSGQPNQPRGDQPNRHQQRGQPTGQRQGRQPNQQQGQSPGTGQQYQQPPGGRQPQQGQPPQGGGRPGQPGGGHSRRDLLKYGGGAAVLGGVGILGYTMLTGSGGPAGTTRSFIEALDEGDVERANSLIHDDAPMQQLSALAGSTLEGTDISIESTEIVSQSQQRAEVRIELSVSAGGLGGGTNDGLVELRTQNGQWRVWQMN